MSIAQRMRNQFGQHPFRAGGPLENCHSRRSPPTSKQMPDVGGDGQWRPVSIAHPAPPPSATSPPTAHFLRHRAGPLDSPLLPLPIDGCPASLLCCTRPSLAIALVPVPRLRTGVQSCGDCRAESRRLVGTNPPAPPLLPQAVSFTTAAPPLPPYTRILPALLLRCFAA